MQAGFSSGVVSPWWPFLSWLRVFNREYEWHEGCMKEELSVTWHFCLDECVASDTWRQISCHQRGDVRSGKSGVLQKATKLVASEETWWSLTKRSKFAMYCALAAFWPKAAAEKDFSSLHDFYFLLGHLSSHRTIGSTKMIWFASSPTSPSQMRVQSAAATKIPWCSVQQQKRQSTIPTGGLGSLPVAHPISPRQALMNAIQHQQEHKAHWLHPLWHRASCQAPRSCSDCAECRGVRSLCWILRNGQQMGTIR